MQAKAEEIPLKNASLDGIICKGVIPYTDPMRAFPEIRRVLKADASAHCMYLGAGYYLRYLLCGEDGEVLGLLEIEAGMHSCLEPKPSVAGERRRQEEASPWGRGYRHRSAQARSLTSCSPRV